MTNASSPLAAHPSAVPGTAAAGMNQAASADGFAALLGLLTGITGGNQTPATGTNALASLLKNALAGGNTVPLADTLKSATDTAKTVETGFNEAGMKLSAILAQSLLAATTQTPNALPMPTGISGTAAAANPVASVPQSAADVIAGLTAISGTSIPQTGQNPLEIVPTQTSLVDIAPKTTGEPVAQAVLSKALPLSEIAPRETPQKTTVLAEQKTPVPLQSTPTGDGILNPTLVPNAANTAVDMPNPVKEAETNASDLPGAETAPDKTENILPAGKGDTNVPTVETPTLTFPPLVLKFDRGEPKPVNGALEPAPQTVEAVPMDRVSNLTLPLVKTPEAATLTVPAAVNPLLVGNPGANRSLLSLEKTLFDAASLPPTTLSLENGIKSVGLAGKSADSAGEQASQNAREESMDDSHRGQSGAVPGMTDVSHTVSGEKVARPENVGVARTAETSAVDTAASVRDRARVVEQVSHKLDTMRLLNGRQEITLHLKPEHLGNLQMTITTDRENVTARILAETSTAKQAVEEGKEHLRSTLENKGFQLQGLDVSLDQQRGQERAFQPFSFEQTPNRPFRPLVPTVVTPEDDTAAAAGKVRDRAKGRLDYMV